MDGGAVYFPCACIWLAVFNGIEPNAANYVLLVILATFCFMGTAPVPNASLALIMTAYNAVFDTTGEPGGFGYIFAVDWFMDLSRTLVNVTGDTFVTAIVSGICPLDYTEEEELDEARNIQIGSSVGGNIHASSSYAYASDHFGASPEIL